MWRSSCVTGFEDENQGDASTLVVEKSQKNLIDDAYLMLQMGYAFGVELLVDASQLPVDSQDNKDVCAVYEGHKLFLQHLSYCNGVPSSQQPPPVWVLYSHCHAMHLEALFKAYPNARIVFVHRNPMEWFPCWAANMVRCIGAGSSVNFLPARLLQHMTTMLHAVCDFRETHRELLDRQWVDIHYTQLRSNPEAVLQDLLAKFGLSARVWSSDFSAAVNETSKALAHATLSSPVTATKDATPRAVFCNDSAEKQLNGTESGGKHTALQDAFCFYNQKLATLFLKSPRRRRR